MASATSECVDLERAIEIALGCLRSGPSLSAFGIAREDCALVHIDYFSEIQGASSVLANALAEVRGTDAATIYREFGPGESPCDCRSCVGEEKARAAKEKHAASYSNVKEWVDGAN